MQTLKYFCQLSKYFWWGKGAWRRWLLFASTLLMSIIIVQVSVYVTLWNKDFYDALANLEKDLIWQLVGQYFIYMSIIIGCVVLGSFLRKKLMFWWREELTHKLENLWLANHNHYRLQQDLPQEQQFIDNPDQRIAEDVMLLCSYTIDLVRGLFMNIFRLVSFVSILWLMSSVVTFTIAGIDWQITGYLVWVALLYASLCSLIMHAVGYKLQGLNVQQQHLEANYRGQLVRLQESSEAIALYQGEANELKRLNQQFNQIKDNWASLIWREVKVETFSATSLRITLFIPLLATLPMYLSGQMTFGAMMQARSAFANVQDGFNWFVDSYKTIIKWAAVVQRLGTFHQRLLVLSASEQEKKGLQRRTQEEQEKKQQFKFVAANIATSSLPRIEVKQVEIRKEQTSLLKGVSFTLSQLGWYQLQGNSGLGKTSLLRCLAGIKPASQGEIQVQATSVLFIPQKPYLFQASLQEVLSYPQVELISKETCKQLLQRVGLASLIPQLEQVKAWQQVLSGGEQQRLSLARVLHLQPQVLILDEATNQLDGSSALALMQELKQSLSQSLVLLTTHQPEIANLCEQQINLAQFKA
ncbi:ABC transporter ATP-binding protein/permease [Psittacicella gerlachiana]|uniref:ATP-binding cassette transporter n=1 Tax=Psittacicella gerlachiana TaxID=2028574 RepID=A0A3A1YAM6_9GAMM|nr:ABC transporter ATP-binding protein/permease [Psittacicella gerlachiana]RIY34260.1 hypothetical protein CKF59_05755 [Psittacicella gerlachiana]